MLNTMVDKLKRELNLLDVFSIASGAMISSGLFILPALAYAKAGPAVVFAYILAGMLFLPSIFTFAIFGVLAFGDTAASIIGMKFGKQGINHNKKSWEGVVAGYIFSYLVVYLFLGPFFAVVAAIIEIIIDIFTPKPIKVSDNLLIPLVLTGVFIVLSICGVPALPIIPYKI